MSKDTDATITIQIKDDLVTFTAKGTAEALAGAIIETVIGVADFTGQPRDAVAANILMAILAFRNDPRKEQNVCQTNKNKA